MWFKKSKPIVKKAAEVTDTVESRMEEYKANSRLVGGFDIENNKKTLFIKVYYTEGTTQGGKNILYADLFEGFLDIGWKFQGVREYAENHELCFTFIKG